MSRCCDGHSLCDACQKIKNEAKEREEWEHRRARGVPRGESLQAMMMRLMDRNPESRKHAQFGNPK